MIRLRFTKTEDLSQEHFNFLLAQLPDNVQEKVMRYRFEKDRKMALVSRALLMAELTDKSSFNWSNMKLGSKGKPYLHGAEYFNWSHSENMVVVGFSDSPIGVDVEKQKKMDWESLLSYFHEQEQNYIKQANNPLQKYYEVWTRKEAYLKGVGSGLTDEMNTIDCSKSSVGNKLVWNICTHQIPTDYVVSFCTLAPMKNAEILEIPIENLIKNLTPN